MNIDNILASKEWEVRNLLRRHRIVGPPTMATIELAHKKKGAGFMVELLRIIAPESNFGENLGQVVNPDSLLSQNIQATKAQTATKGRFWSFWDNLLSRVVQTGDAIGQFKNASNPVDSYTQAVIVQEQQRSKIIFGTAVVIILVVVLILVFRRK